MYILRRVAKFVSGQYILLVLKRLIHVLSKLRIMQYFLIYPLLFPSSGIEFAHLEMHKSYVFFFSITCPHAVASMILRIYSPNWLCQI